MPPPPICAIIAYPDGYVQPLILQALSRLSDLPMEIRSSPRQTDPPSRPTLQISAYEALNFDHALSNPRTSLVCAYVIRKALIRKHFLSNTISTWLVKHPQSLLQHHFKPAVHFELDYAEYLDEALVDAWDLNESMQRNAHVHDKDKQWWILKPGMSDGGNGIRLFSSMEDLQSIFDEWEESRSNSDQGDEDGDETERPEGETGDEHGGALHEAADRSDAPQSFRPPNAQEGVMTSQLRHFIAQPYIDPPLLLPSRGHRKFHIRTYVLAVGALKVYVYREMLALFAAVPYQPPLAGTEPQAVDLASHLTNTCFQDEATREGSVHRFWALRDESLPPDWQEKVFAQICDVTAEIFEAAAREQMVHFQTLPNAFEIFGVDFLVDSDLHVWLLELNAYPDFKQTGQDLQPVVGGLFNELVNVAVAPFFDATRSRDGTQGMRLVRDLDLGRR